MPINVDPIVSGAWRYSDRAHVAQLIDNANIVATWDMNDDGVEDTGLLESDGVASDTYIDRFLLAAGLTAPIDTSTASATTVQSLAEIGAHMTVWYGWHHRGIAEIGNRLGRSPDAIAGLMSGYKTYADEELAKLVTILQAADQDDDSVAPGTFQTLDVVDSSEACTTDENGNLVAPLSWWF